MSSIYQNKKKYNRMIEKIRNFDVPNLSVYNESFDNVIINCNNETLYLDPPYYLGKDKDNKMFKGMYPMANFAFHHENFDHELLNSLLINYKGKFILSYNNCEKIREMYKNFNLYFPT
jgi:DNA adenine methylase